MRKYGANYVYVGKSERQNAPGCLNKFKECKQLEQVYEDPTGKNLIFKLRNDISQYDR